ncbi:baseplate J/gp47 family protein [Pseudomonas citronellolis]|uniref:baseplate J/gp47 family protein n=1 Tax=Pseudomonas citronellolis TaxID=53408 RepID=UPI00389B19C8
MASSTAPTIDSSGISAPNYADALAYLQQSFRSIYGADVYLGNDSQDGQLLSVLALAISDANAAIISAYNAFSPNTAQGNGLSSNVKINGISRGIATNSQVDLQVGGQAGTIISQGIARDVNGNTWALPATVTIPPAGTITVTATCTAEGAVSAGIGQVNIIATPTRGWQTVTNASAAEPGAPVETDSALRQRQQTSVALPSRTVLEGTTGAVANITGVTRLATYENDTNSTDSNGIPAHSISLVVEGGDAAAIAQAIADKKTPGTGTYGSTSQSVTDVYGRPLTINFYRPTYQAMTVAISLKALAGYSSNVGAAVQQAVSDYINGVAIGGGLSKAVEWADAITAANSVANSNTFKLTALTITGPGGAGSPDVALAFNQAATCTPASVTLTVT